MSIWQTNLWRWSKAPTQSGFIVTARAFVCCQRVGLWQRWILAGRALKTCKGTWTTTEMTALTSERFSFRTMGAKRGGIPRPVLYFKCVLFWREARFTHWGTRATWRLSARTMTAKPGLACICSPRAKSGIRRPPMCGIKGIASTW